LPRSTVLLPVHQRRTLRADGSIVEVLTVFCSMKTRSIPTSSCNDCDRCQIVVLGKDDAPRFVVCESGPPIEETDPGTAPSPHSTPVWGAMSRAALCVEPEVPALGLAKVLVDAAVDCAPVVDRDATLLGIVTRRDLMRWQWRDGSPAVSVHSLMRPARYLLAATPVATAGALMASEGMEAVAVVSSEIRPTVVGVVTARDVMAWFAHPPGHAREGHLPGTDA
jgi:CBS domain-containing protein